MKNKKFLIICLSLIVITTISLCVNTILNKKDTKINLEELNKNVFEYSFKDNLGETKQTIEFQDNKIIKKTSIKSYNESINDINETYTYPMYLNNGIIYVTINDNTYSYKYENKCIYDVSNEDIKYCIKK